MKINPAILSWTAGLKQEIWDIWLVENCKLAAEKKDMIIVGGKDICSQEIEDLESSFPGVHTGKVAVFGILNNEMGTKDVVVVAEMEAKQAEYITEIEQEIRKNVIQNSAIALRNVFLVPKKRLIKTNGGKIARAAHQEKFLKETS